MARYVIGRIHSQNNYLNNEQIKSYIANTFKKYQRKSIQEEVEIFCYNLAKIPMAEIKILEQAGNKITITKDQKDYYKQKTDEAQSFLKDFGSSQNYTESQYTAKELKQIHATLYHINENKLIAQ